MEVPMETCPFMSRLYLPRYLFFFFSPPLPFSVLSLKVNLRFGLDNILCSRKQNVLSKCIDVSKWTQNSQPASQFIFHITDG